MEFVVGPGDELNRIISSVAEKIKLTGRLVKIYNQKLIGYWKNVYFLELLGTYDSWKRRHRGLFSSCMNHARGN